MSRSRFDDYLHFGASGRRVVAYHADFVDMIRLGHDHHPGDNLAALLLAQLVFWHQPNEATGEPRLQVERDGHLWLVRGYGDWDDELRFTEAQARRSVDLLIERGLVEKRIGKFNAVPMVHLRILGEAFMDAFERVTSQVKPHSRKNTGPPAENNGTDPPKIADGSAGNNRSDLPENADPLTRDHGTETTNTEPQQTTLAADGGISWTTELTEQETDILAGIFLTPRPAEANDEEWLVWLCWLANARRPRPAEFILTVGRSSRLAAIRAAKRQGYSYDDMRDACRGWVWDAWEGRENQNDLTILLRLSGNLDNFKTWHRHPESRPRRTVNGAANGNGGRHNPNDAWKGVETGAEVDA